MVCIAKTKLGCVNKSHFIITKYKIVNTTKDKQNAHTLVNLDIDALVITPLSLIVR